MRILQGTNKLISVNGQMKKKLQLTVMLIMLLVPVTNNAWDAVAHQVIFDIASQQLTPTAKQHMTQLLHAYPDELTANGNELPAATWADRIKGDHIRTFNHWHYIDQAWSETAIELPTPRGTNILTALEQSERIIQSKQSTQLERAMYLRFLLHFEGDLHQPLHVTTHVSPKYPKGDHGGLMVKIRAPHASNLHQLWDSGFNFCIATPRTYYDEVTIHTCSALLTKKHPLSSFSTAALNASHARIAQDGINLTRKEVYQMQEQQEISNAYIQRNRAIAQQQIALAGYRLGKRLNSLFSTDLS